MRVRGEIVPGRAGSSLSVTKPVDPPVFDVGWLYRTYAAKVGRWAARLGGPSIEAEDVVQEVFLVAKRRLITFRPDGNGKITTWLFRATERIVRAARRKQRWRRFVGMPDDDGALGGDTAGPIPGAPPGDRARLSRPRPPAGTPAPRPDPVRAGWPVDAGDRDAHGCPRRHRPRLALPCPRRLSRASRPVDGA
jgi:hypothetical protein